MLLFIFSVIIHVKVLLHPVMPLPVADHPFHNWLLALLIPLFGKNGFWFTVFVIVNTFLQSLYLVNITSRYRFFSKVTYVPAYAFILLATVFPAFSTFGETFFLNWILLIGLDTMFGFSQTNQPRKLIFNAGFLLGAAALFQASMLVFFLLLLVAMVMFRSFDPGEWSVALMGFFTPLYFFAGIAYLTDHTSLLGQWWHLGFSFGHLQGSRVGIATSVGGMFLLLLFGVFAIQTNLATSNIYIRRNWIVIAFYLIIALLVAFVTDFAMVSAWLIAIPPLSLFLAQALLLEKNKAFCNFILYFSLVFIIFCLWANK